MKTRNTTMKLIAVMALAIATPQTGYPQRVQDVNVVNTPNVNAQQRGAWSVGINPSSNTVHVASSSQEPVSITQALQVANVFQKELAVLLLGYPQGSASFTVPAGKLLVIKDVSALGTTGGLWDPLCDCKNDREQQPCDALFACFPLSLCLF